MSAGEVPPPVSRGLPLGRRQLAFCLLAGWTGFMAARHWLMPAWIERAASGRATIARAMDQAIAEVVGIALASAAAALFACTLYNLVRRERRRRAGAAARELAFVTSLGHCAKPLSPSNESPRR